MEFDPSVDDEEQYSKVIAPYFLNSLNVLTNSKTSVHVRKIDVFRKAIEKHLGAFKGDRNELERYLSLKGSDEYTGLIKPVIGLLVKRNFIKLAVNPAEIMITQEGIDMCNTEGTAGWYYKVYQIE
jgi:hypothetical protein